MTHKMNWCLGLFREWRIARNVKAALHPELNIRPVEQNLEDMSMEDLNFYICRFIYEVRKLDGSEYPLKTIQGLTHALQTFFQKHGKVYKFLKDSYFMPIQKTMDSIAKRKEMGGEVVKTKPLGITLDEEESLWGKGVLGTDNPKSLLNAVFYTLSVGLGLRSGTDHRALIHGRNSKLKLMTLPNGTKFLRYQDRNTSAEKTYKKSKMVDVYPNTKNPNRCPVMIYEIYVSRCEKNGNLDDIGAFYLRPSSHYEKDNWFTTTPIGRHILGHMMKKICSEGGVLGHRTNNSAPLAVSGRTYTPQEAETHEDSV